LKDITVPALAIRDALLENGWTVAEVVKAHEWWCAEYWRIQSTWSPQQAQAYLLFLADPQDTHPWKHHLDHREVWAVAASTDVPADRPVAGRFAISLNGWRAHIPELMQHLQGIRSASAV
jgi:hypothetical protein